MHRERQTSDTLSTDSTFPGLRKLSDVYPVVTNSTMVVNLSANRNTPFMPQINLDISQQPVIVNKENTQTQGGGGGGFPLHLRLHMNSSRATLSAAAAHNLHVAH